MARKWHAKLWKLKGDTEHWQGAMAGIADPGEYADEILPNGNYSSLFVYMFRRFGIPENGSDLYDVCRELTTNQISVYCLIGYNDVPCEAVYKLEMVRSWGVQPNPMRYQPLDDVKKNEFRIPEMQFWTEKQLADTMRYYSRLNWLGHIPFSDYKGAY